MEVRPDISGALARLRLTREEVRREIPKALNDTIKWGRTQVARSISNNYGAQVGALKKGFDVSRATQGRLQAGLHASGKKLNWIYFGAREVASGVAVKVSGKIRVIKHAFIAVLKGANPSEGAAGNRFVVKRMDGAKHVSRKLRKGGPALKIKLLSGPSVPDMFNTTIRTEKLDEELRARFPVQLNEALRSARFRQR